MFKKLFKSEYEVVVLKGGSSTLGSDRDLQEKLHNLSMMLTEKNEAIENMGNEVNR